MEFHEKVERSIITKYRKEIWRKFISGVNDYDLIQEGDKIAVCISGGKDSMLLAKCMQELQKHGKVKFDIVYLVMDPGYNERNRQVIIDNAKLLNIPIQMFESDIFDIVADIEDSPCYLCARMRRGCLYGKAQELGCNKIALGHHFDDVIETTMLNVLYSGNFKTMLPKLKASNFEGMQLIRPLYYIKEKDIKNFTQGNGLWTMNCGCVVAADKIGGKRFEIKDMIANLKETFPDVDKSIFKAAQNVNMDSILGWQKNGEKFSFLEEFEKE